MCTYVTCNFCNHKQLITKTDRLLLKIEQVIFPTWKKTKVLGEGEHAVKTWPTLLTFSSSTIGNIASAHAGQ